VARVFISHANQDLTVARRIAGWFRDAGHRVFLDNDLGGLRPGDALADRLFAELYAADCLVAVVTAAFVASPWCAAEVGIARAHGLRILPVRVEKDASHPLIPSETYSIDLDGDGTPAQAMLVEALRQLYGALWAAGLPLYPGLVPFDAGQARVFFGRNSESRRLAEQLRLPVGPAGGGLLAVVGPSGCGKSSLVRAGLVPLLAGDPDWLVLPPLVPAADPVAVLVPAADPVADPVAVLVRLLAGEGRRRGLDWTAEDVTATVARPGGLTRLLAELLANAAPARRLLLVIDQAEELLTRTSEAARRRFAALLAEATGGPRPPSQPRQPPHRPHQRSGVRCVRRRRAHPGHRRLGQHRDPVGYPRPGPPPPPRRPPARPHRPRVVGGVHRRRRAHPGHRQL
jgi:hypothetical protein